ncbi:hypothetical protein jhhlp_004855 [Lomentospora prolificans]|uniref:Uncharacterized protein n=1 Tax=Lomentospora prolificans TaxID=41688 RepID=A0A2N3N7X8_9PEZI|nr:hypothetical protein jhhlp_004855 [Lomentospora prolificans]
MNILDLPPELLHLILVRAVLARGVTRGLRLKLVCKRFSAALQPALFESRLLDTFYPGDLLENWYIRNQHGAEKFWHSYLHYRVRNETDPSVGRLMELGQLARSFCARTSGADYDATLSALCWMALERGASLKGYRWCWILQDDREVRLGIPNPGLNLLCAAAYLNNMHLAKELLDEGHCATADDELLPSPMQSAAWAGNTDMLVLLQQSLPEFEDSGPRHIYHNTWYGKIGPGSLTGAAYRGDMDMIRLAAYPPSRRMNQSSDFVDQPFGRVDPYSKPGMYINKARWETKNWDVFRYLSSFFRDPWYDATPIMARHAFYGNIDMVVHFLDAGLDVNGRDVSNGCPLINAARGCHKDIVDLLLERGADPNHTVVGYPGSALSGAVRGGSMVILRKLLEYGARPDREGRILLNYAVQLEHVEMVELLLEKCFGSPDGGFTGG